MAEKKAAPKKVTVPKKKEAPAPEPPMSEQIYIAAPFFTPEQVKVVEMLECIAVGVSKKLFSPRLDGGVLEPTSSKEERREIFSQNCEAIDASSLVIACIDDFDPGTIWEMGYAFKAGKDIVTYSHVPGRGLNVMLAQSCVLFANGLTDLHFKLMDFIARKKTNEWEGDVQ